jgi:hypothetical protein
MPKWKCNSPAWAQNGTHQDQLAAVTIVSSASTTFTTNTDQQLSSPDARQ